MQPFDDHLTIGAHPRQELLEQGISAYELRGPLWAPVSRGLYTWAATDNTHPRGRIHAAAARLAAGGVVTGWAAAWLHGAGDLDGLAPNGITALPVPLCTTPRHHLVLTPDVRVSRSRLEPEDIDEVEHLPCASLVRAAFDATRFAVDLTEAVVVLDALLRTTTLRLDDVRAYADARRRWHGRRQVLQAIDLANPWSLSCPESRLRVLWVVTAELPMPEVNRTILDEHAQVVAMADVLDEAAQLVGEYDGAHHAVARQRQADDDRTQRLHTVGLHVVRFTSVALQPRHRFRTATDLRRLRVRRLAQVKGQTRRWHLLARPAGGPAVQ